MYSSESGTGIDARNCRASSQTSTYDDTPENPESGRRVGVVGVDSACDSEEGELGVGRGGEPMRTSSRAPSRLTSTYDDTPERHESGRA